MEELTVNDYIAIFRWRKKHFFLTFAVLWTMALIFAMCWSNYRSVTTVEIEQPQIAADMATPMGMNVNTSTEALADLRIGKIMQKVTAPGQLIEIITKYNLYSGARKYQPMTSIAANMRKKIKLDLVGSAIVNPAATQKVSAAQLSAIAFNLSFDYSNPQVARDVANELVTRFLDEDLKQRREQSESTSQFLSTQIKALEASMVDQEKRIAEFQEKHGISRPEALMFNQQAAASTLASIQGLDAQLTTNEGTQNSLRAQLAIVDPYTRVIADGQVLTTPATQLKALEAQYTTLTAQYGPDHPDVIKTRNQISALRAESSNKKSGSSSQLKAQVDDVRTNLQAAKKTYGAKHPDTIALQKQLDKLQAQLAKGDISNTMADRYKQDADNPAYIEIAMQLKTAEEQHKSLITQRASLAQQQAKYQDAVTRNPALEQQMASLTRDYDNAQLRYRDLKEKKMASDMDEQMIQDRKSERLVVISPPDLPLSTSPSRLLIIAGGFVFALFGGIGCVILMQILRHSVLGTQHLGSLVGVMPLVAIPHIYTRREMNRINRRKPLAVGGAIALAIITVIVFDQSVMHIDTLISTLSQRIGL